MNTLSLKTEQYEGPLDLLLALISKHKIDILDIPISQIAEQYMAYINSMIVLNMEVTSEFIAMAAELMLIKSRLLLPKQEGEEDPRRPLVDALLEHQRAVAAAGFLKERSELYFDRFTKEPDIGDGVYSRSHAVTLLQEAFLRISERSQRKPEQEEEKLFAKIENERYYTVDEKIFSLMRMLARKGSCPLEEVFSGVKSRGELVALFLALLETVSKGRVAIIKEGRRLSFALIRNEE